MVVPDLWRRRFGLLLAGTQQQSQGQKASFQGQLRSPHGPYGE